MNILGVTWEEIFTLLLIAMGPVSVTMSYMPIAQALPPAMQRKLAWRTVLVGFIVAVLLIIFGGGVIRRFHLSLAVLLMGVGVTYFVLALPMLLARPSDLSPQTPIKEPLRLAISPLAVPAMISPLAMALLFSVSAFSSSLIATLIFLGIVVVVLLINLGFMLLSTYVAKHLTNPILEVFQKIFGFILLTFSIQLMLQALVRLGFIPAKGF